MMVVGTPFLKVVGDIVAAWIGAGILEVNDDDPMVKRRRLLEVGAISALGPNRGGAL